MRKKTSLSYNKKRLKRLPKIQGSNINLSINNTYVVIKNQSPNNYSYIQKDILPNIFSYSHKKKENILSPIKKDIKQIKINENLNNIDFIRKDTVITQKTTDDFVLTTKLLNRLLWFFNIRELLILMNINKKIHNFIKNTQIFQKYINLRKELKNGNLLNNINNNKILQNLKTSFLKKSNNNIKIQINTESSNYHFNSNENNNKDINTFLKYNLFNKKRLKLKKILNNEIYLSQLSLNSNDSQLPNIKNNKKLYNNNSNIQIRCSNLTTFSNNIIESSNNSVISSNTGSSKNENKENISKNENNIIFNEILKYDKLNSYILSLIKNNGNKMLLLMKKYKLTYIENKVIFYGIIESILLKKQEFEKEKHNNFFSTLILQNIKADKYMIYYLDPILNLNFEDITKIHFDNAIISSIKIMKKICNLLWRNFTSIKLLLLPNNSIDDNCAKLLFTTLKYNKSLTILNLSNNTISNNSIIYSDLFFKNNTTLNTLVLSNNYLGTNGSNNLMNYLKYNKNSVLRTLDIGYNGISDKGVISLVEYINTNEKLLSLFFNGNYICDKGLDLFVKTLINRNNNNNNINNDINKNNIKLSYLDLSNDGLTKNSCKYINKILSISSFITSINLSYNKILNEGVINILSFINNKSKLVSLDLSETFIDEKSIEFLSDKLDKTIVLRILNLSNNNLGKACIYLKKLLIKETNIKILKLVSCDISENINLLFQGLSKNDSIETFDISSNKINMNSNILNDVFYFFKENKKIINLILDNTNIDNIGINYISQGIEINKSIKKLSLKNNFISNEIIDKLKNSIQKNKIIRKIELEGNGISQKNKQLIDSILSEKLNRNKIS